MSAIDRLSHAHNDAVIREKQIIVGKLVTYGLSVGDTAEVMHHIDNLASMKYNFGFIQGQENA